MGGVCKVVQDITGYITINNDMWDDSGVVYKVLSYFKDGKSTGIKLELLSSDGTIHKRTVPEGYIEWIPDGELNVSF